MDLLKCNFYNISTTQWANMTVYVLCKYFLFVYFFWLVVCGG